MPNSPMPDDSDPQVAADSDMRRFRERVAATIAIVVVLASLAMVGMAFSQVDNKDKFDHAKDLLLIMNPILGVVIGYYFNKVSMEGRAESAESTAKTATVSARQAQEARDKAEDVADSAKTEAEETRSHLENLSRAAEKMLAQASDAGPGVLGTGDRANLWQDARSQLEAALARAKRTAG